MRIHHVPALVFAKGYLFMVTTGGFVCRSAFSGSSVPFEECGHFWLIRLLTTLYRSGLCVKKKIALITNQMDNQHTRSESHYTSYLIREQALLC